MRRSTTLLWALGSFTVIVLFIVAGSLIYGTRNHAQNDREVTYVIITEEVEAGETIFYGEKEIEGFVPCVYCHPINTEKPRSTMVGPNMSNIANRAEEAVPGMSAADYLREAIVNPNSHLSKGVPENVMFSGYKDTLSEQEIDELVAFLLTLRGRNVIQVRPAE